MQSTKPWYRSRTIWAGIASLIIVVISLFRPEASVDHAALVEVLMALAAAVAGVVAIWGRVVARANIAPLDDEEWRCVAPVALLVIVMTVGGCGAVTTADTFGPGGISSTNQAAQQAGIIYDPADGSARILTNYSGLGGTVWMQDAEGTWTGTQGPGGLLTYDPASGRVYLWSPKDATIESLTFTPAPARGQPSLQVTGLTLNVSDPLDRYVGAIAEHSAALLGMTQAEAAKQIEQWREAGKITANVAEALLRAFVPTLP